MISGQDVPDLMIIYGLGAASVFLTLAAMYRYALSNAKELDLNEIELFDTRMSIRTNFLMAMVPVLSVLMAFVFYGHWRAGIISGFTYYLYPLVMIIHSKRVMKQRKRLLLSIEKQASSN
jgi:flagellar biosynthesis protein FlhB